MKGPEDDPQPRGRRSVDLSVSNKDALTAEDQRVLVKVLTFIADCSAAAPGVHPTSAPEPLELTFLTVGCRHQFMFIER